MKDEDIMEDHGTGAKLFLHPILFLLCYHAGAPLEDNKVQKIFGHQMIRKLIQKFSF